jgi:hypothetical protein
MGLDIPVIDYTKREYTTNKEELQQLIKLRFPDDWTDFLDSNLGEAILELVSYDYTLQSFMLDEFANESFLEPTQLRENLLRLIALIAYPVSGATSASVSINASLFSTEINNVTIRKGTKVSTVDKVIFEVATDFIISAGNLTPMALVLSASPTRTISFVQASRTVTFNLPLPDNVTAGQSLRATSGSDLNFYQIRAIADDRLSADLYTAWPNLNATVQFEVYNRQITLIQGETKTDTNTSDGTANQQFITVFSQVAEGSLIVTVNGEEWTEIESLIYSNSGKNYETSVDATDKVIVRFGDGIAGKIPDSGAIIGFTYRITVGSSGNIAINAINTSINGYIGLSNTVNVMVSNPINRGSGGNDRETMEHIKKFAPLYTRTNDRAVTAEDYGTLSSVFSDPTYGTVAEASAILNTNTVPRENNLVFVYIWAEGLTGELLPPSDGLRTALKDYLDTKKMIGTEVLVLPGINKVVNVTAVVGFDDRLDSTITANNVTAAIQGVFEAVTFSPGDSLYISKLYEAIEAVQGVSNVYIMTDPVDDQGRINSENYEIITPGTIEVKRLPIPPVWLIVPLAGVVGVPLTIKWSAVTGIDGYVLQEASLSNFADAVDIYSGTATEFTFSKGAAGIYYYRMKTFNVYGQSYWRNSSNSLTVS